MSQTTRDKTVNPTRERRILDAAALLISRFGYDKTTVSDIARQAGISKGAVYLHWASKEALFEALLWHEIQRYAGQWLAHFEDEPGDFSIMTMFKAMLRALHDNPFMLALMRRAALVPSKEVCQTVNHSSPSRKSPLYRLEANGPMLR